jgi:hypothetical protein
MARPHDKIGHFVEVLLERLLATALSLNERKAIIGIFVDVMDELGELGKGELGRIGVWEDAAKFWNGEVADIFEAAIRSGESINWLAEVLRDQGFAHGRPEAPRSAIERQWLTEEQLDCAITAAIDRFKSIGLPTLFKKPEPLEILYCWLQLGNPDELRQVMTAAIERNEVFIGALHAMQSWSSGSDGVHHPLYRQTVAHFMDADAAKLRLEQLAQGGSEEQVDIARKLSTEWSDRTWA